MLVPAALPLISLVISSTMAAMPEVADDHENRDQNEEPVALQKLAHRTASFLC
jgi:hypothetical protein